MRAGGPASRGSREEPQSLVCCLALPAWHCLPCLCAFAPPTARRTSNTTLTGRYSSSATCVGARVCVCLGVRRPYDVTPSWTVVYFGSCRWLCAGLCLAVPPLEGNLAFHGEVYDFCNRPPLALYWRVDRLACLSVCLSFLLPVPAAPIVAVLVYYKRARREAARSK